MDHLAVADVDAAVIRARADVARLRVRDLLPAEEGIGRTETGVRSSQAVAHEARAVKSRGAAGAPDVLAAELAVRTVNNRIARGRIVRGLRIRLRLRVRCGGGSRLGLRLRLGIRGYRRLVVVLIMRRTVLVSVGIALVRGVLVVGAGVARVGESTIEKRRC